MAAETHRYFLHELLEQEQEPFHLNDYIAGKRFDLKTVCPKSNLQVKKRKPISRTSIFPENFCKNVCFLSSFQPSSPDIIKSPLFEFCSSAMNSPCKSPNAILLLEAAARKIHKHKQKRNWKSKTKQIKNQGANLFGSVLKRLTNRNRNRNVEFETDGIEMDLSSFGRRNQSRNGFWSESNEERSMDFGTSCSSQCRSEDSDELSFAFSGEDFCSSPFRFVLQRSPSYGRRTPDFQSPASSPKHFYNQDKTSKNAESMKGFEVEEEDKEQCSPVSVLDTPFDDGFDDGNNDRGRDRDRDADYDMECNFAALQRKKQQLFNKLRRFERLSNLSPIDLEKVMLDGDEEQYEKDHNDFEIEDHESIQLDNEDGVEWSVEEAGSNSSFCKESQIPNDMSKLIVDLVAEEEVDRDDYDDSEEVARRVCKRLEEWEEVELNTIDMMVEEELKKEVNEWKRNGEERGVAAMDVELDIFSFLVEELAMELTCSNGN